MNKEKVIKELTLCADLCPTSPLAEACRTAVALITDKHDCGTCKHASKTSKDEPCKNCYFLAGDKWEPKT